MKSRKFIKANVIFFCLAFFYPSCKEKEDYTKLDSTKENKNLFFDFKIGDVPIKVEAAVLPEERSRGLMFRESMALNEGMLFVFEKGTSQRFWMKNTRIPL